MQFIGDTSYSIYLWHWPVLIIAPFAFGVTDLSFSLSVSLLANIILLAYITKRYVEDPVRQSKRLTGTNLKTYAYGVVSILIVIGTTYAVQVHPKAQSFGGTGAEALQTVPENDPCLGAGVLRDAACSGKYGNEALTSLSFAKTDKSVLYKDGCSTVPPLFPKENVCKRGDRDGTTRVALFGNSHAVMWFEAMDTIAMRNGWQLDTYLASSCFPMDYLQALDERYGVHAPENCQSYYRWAMEEIIAQKYDVVVIASRSGTDIKGAEQSNMHAKKVAGYSDTISRLATNNIKVFILRDSPDAKDMESTPDCLAKNDGDAVKCDGRRELVLTPDPLFDAGKASTSLNVHTLDLTNRFCDATTCWSVIGGIVVHSDSNHLTTSYVKTLIPDVQVPLKKFMDK